MDAGYKALDSMGAANHFARGAGYATAVASPLTARVATTSCIYGVRTAPHCTPLYMYPPAPATRSTPKEQLSRRRVCPQGYRGCWTHRGTGGTEPIPHQGYRGYWAGCTGGTGKTNTACLRGACMGLVPQGGFANTHRRLL